MQGRRVSFKNALVVMTSNVGSAAIAKGGRASIGFMIEDNENSSYAAMQSLIMEELKGYFRPELLNRIDEVVVFHPLEKAQVCRPFFCPFLFPMNTSDFSGWKASAMFY